MPDLSFKIEDATAIPYRLRPCSLEAKNYKCRCRPADSHGRFAVPDTNGSEPPPLHARRTSEDARPLRRAPALEPDASQPALDPRKCCRAQLPGQHTH